MVDTPRSASFAELHVTLWLHSWRSGDSSAEQRPIGAVSSLLRQMAVRMMSKERPDHTVRPTGLVHEDWLRMCGPEADYQNRTRSLSLFAIVMRRVLVDRARARAVPGVSQRAAQRHRQFSKRWIKAAMQHSG